MKQRVLALLVALSLVCAASVSAFADETSTTAPDPIVDVTLTLSQGTEYYTSEHTDDILVLQEMTVPYFDLALYGLEDYYYNPDCYSGEKEDQKPGTKEQAEGYVTAYHAIIYATEVYALGIPEDEAGQGAMYESGDMATYLPISGEVGSSFIESFWDVGYNLNYFVNYKYPLGSSGWGATLDQVVLHDGDHLSIHCIADETWTMQGTSFGYFEADGVLDYATVKQGETITLDMLYTERSYESDETLTVPGAGVSIGYTSELSAAPGDWQSLGETDANGQIEIDTTGWDAGTYYIGTNSEGVCLGNTVGTTMEPAPAVFELTVEASSETGGDQGSEEETVVYGDVNGDSKIDSGDASMILRYAADLITEMDTTAADVNGDGKVDAGDASVILRYAAGLITTFPVEANS